MKDALKTIGLVVCVVVLGIGMLVLMALTYHV